MFYMLTWRGDGTPPPPWCWMVENVGQWQVLSAILRYQAPPCRGAGARFWGGLGEESLDISPLSLLSTLHYRGRASSRGDVQGRLQQQQLVRGWRLVSPVVPSSASHSVTTRPRYARRTLGWRIKTAYINVQTSVPISVWLTIFMLPFILFQF